MPVYKPIQPQNLATSDKDKSQGSPVTERTVITEISKVDPKRRSRQLRSASKSENMSPFRSVQAKDNTKREHEAPREE